MISPRNKIKEAKSCLHDCLYLIKKKKVLPEEVDMTEIQRRIEMAISILAG